MRLVFASALPAHVIVVDELRVRSFRLPNERLVVVAIPGGQEIWEETSTRVHPASYWRTDIELRASRETRTAAGAVVGTRATTGPITFSVER